MDAKSEWQLSSDPESLVAAVVGCRELILGVARQKHHLQRAGVVACDAFVGDKLLELLRCSTAWQPCAEVEDDDPTVPSYRRERKVSELVAVFPSFRLHRLPVLKRAMEVRVVMELEVGDEATQAFYGNLAVVGGDAMKEALELLRVCTVRFPPVGRGRHSLTRDDDGRLVLNLFVAAPVVSLVLDPADMALPFHQLIEQIDGLVPRGTRPTTVT